MGNWWHRNIVEPGKLPLLLALAAFVLTFAVTRFVTRMIRAGRGPFHDISPGGRHVHHVVPGVLLMCLGGFGCLATGRHGLVAHGAAVVFGIGTGLVLDEFALLLYLHDVYWTAEGQKSVEVVVVTAALLGFMLAGFSPLGVDDLGGLERAGRGVVVGVLIGNFVLALVALLKGKLRVAAFGLVLPFVALIGAVRLARPTSPWAKRLYRDRPRLRERAERRARKHERRWGRLEHRLDDWLGGTPENDRH